MSVEDQKQLDRNVQRVGMFHALRKINALVQEVENEKRIESQAIKIALGVVGVIGVVLLFYALVESGRVTSPSSAPLVASDRFTSYVNNWAKQVQAKLGNSCINFTETGSQSGGVTLSTSITKDGAVEKIAVTKSSGIKELDDAAVRGVLGAAPFSPLTIEITRDTDILTITRTFWRVPCQQQF
jgi:TonB family protein